MVVEIIHFLQIMFYELIFIIVNAFNIKSKKFYKREF